MFNAKFNHESRFFAGDYEVSGIESLNLSYSAGSKIEYPLGTRKGFNSVASQNSQTLTINRNLIYEDYLLSYTGNNSIDGSIYYDGVHYGFNEGYLSSYSLNCAVGSVPRSSANIFILDEMMTGIDASDNFQVAAHPLIDIPSQGSITMSCDNSSTNRISNFDYSINLKRKPFYGICNKRHQDIRLIPPVEYTCSVQIDVDEAFLGNSWAFFDERENKNVNLNVKGRGGTDLQSVNIPNASLVGESLDVSADGALKLSLNYQGHI